MWKIKISHVLYGGLSCLIGLLLAIFAGVYLSSYAKAFTSKPALHLPIKNEEEILDTKNCNEYTKSSDKGLIGWNDRKDVKRYYGSACKARSKRISIGFAALASGIIRFILAGVFIALSYIFVGKYSVMITIMVVQCVTACTISLGALAANQDNRPKGDRTVLARANKLYSFEPHFPNDALNYFLALDVLYHCCISWYFCLMYFTASHVGMSARHMKVQPGEQIFVMEDFAPATPASSGGKTTTNISTSKVKETDKHTNIEVKTTRLHQKTVYI